MSTIYFIYLILHWHYKTGECQKKVLTTQQLSIFKQWLTVEDGLDEGVVREWCSMNELPLLLCFCSKRSVDCQKIHRIHKNQLDQAQTSTLALRLQIDSG
jgi:hypothetical protein